MRSACCGLQMAGQPHGSARERDLRAASASSLSREPNLRLDLHEDSTHAILLSGVLRRAGNTLDERETSSIGTKTCQHNSVASPACRRGIHLPGHGLAIILRQQAKPAHDHTTCSSHRHACPQPPTIPCFPSVQGCPASSPPPPCRSP